MVWGWCEAVWTCCNVAAVAAGSGCGPAGRCGESLHDNDVGMLSALSKLLMVVWFDYV